MITHYTTFNADFTISEIADGNRKDNLNEVHQVFHDHENDDGSFMNGSQDLRSLSVSLNMEPDSKIMGMI